MKPTLLIYRNELLPSSETFIVSQGESLNSFQTIYIGIKRVPGLDLPKDRCVPLANGQCSRLRAAKLRIWGAGSSEGARLRVLKPALVHAHFGMDAIAAMPIAHRLQVPLVVTFHGWDASVRDDVLQRKSFALNRYVRQRPKLAKMAARVLCVSDFIHHNVLQMGFSPHKTLVHYTGIDTDKFRPDPSLARKRVVLFVGRLVEKKGCEYLLRAMQRVQSQIEQADLVVIGDGALRERLEQLAAATLRSYRFLGSCSPEVVREWMNRARVFSTPSVIANTGDAEGFGMVFAESQAMGLPVASFASGGIPEAVEHGVTGLLAPERDVDALARNISTLLTDDSMWRRFSESGQERVRRCFDLKKQTVRLEEIYQEVLSEHRAGVSYS